MAKAVLSKTSDPSNRMRSQILSTTFLGRHVEKSVRNHCMVNTFVNGGS
jgi:hypothetical protein